MRGVTRGMTVSRPLLKYSTTKSGHQGARIPECPDLDGDGEEQRRK
jgi:hypothetical protein